MFKVGAYLRLSKDDGDKEVSDSIENQKTLIDSFINKHEDMILSDFYIDDGYSGLNFERPSFIRMLAEAYKGNINTIITKDMSRLGREHIETSNYIERVFPLNSIRYIAILDNYDSLTGSNVEIAPFKSLLNDMYAKDISKKVRSAFNSKMTRGEFIGAFAPYGYEKHPNNNDVLVIDKYAAAVVKRIFELYLKGTSKLYIARILNTEGILCPSEYKKNLGLNYKNSNKLKSTSYWTYSTINKILRNEMYLGHMIQRKSETISYKLDKKRSIDKENWIVVENTHEPIISVSDFNTVQKLLETRKRTTKRSGNITIYAGILYCADCGRAMSKSTSEISKGIKANYYKCGTYKSYGKDICTSHTIREDILNEIVLETLREEAKKTLNCQDIENLNCLVEKMKNLNNLVDTHDNVETKLAKINKYLAAAYEDYVDELLTKEDYLLLKERYTKEKKELENRLIESEKLQSEKTEKLSLTNSWIKEFINYFEISEVTRELIVELI